MSSSQESSSSIANRSTTGGETVSMSRYSDAASELGRKLNLGASSPTDDMRTRLQAQRESQQQASSSSRGLGRGSSSKGKGKAKATAEPTRRQPRRESARRPRDPAPNEDDEDDDDDDDESDDSDDDDDGGGDPPPQTPQVPPQEHKRRLVMAIMSAFEPSWAAPDMSQHVTPIEFIEGTGPARMAESSRVYRRLTIEIAQLVRTPGDLTRLLQPLPLDGQFFGDRLQQGFWNHATQALSLFRAARRDAIDTIAELQRIYEQIEATLRTPYLPNLHRDAKGRLVYLLAWILDTITSEDREYRQQTASGPVYAGMGYEYNLYMRFVSTRDNWRVFMEVLRRLIAHDRRLFDQDGVRQCFRSANIRLDHHHPPGSRPTNQSIGDFVVHFKYILPSLGIN